MRKRGFTLIELLVVISILVLLMGLLLPAVIGAKKNMVIVQSRNQISRISENVNVYYQVYNVLPGMPIPWSAKPPMTGAQLLQLALMSTAPSGQPFYALHPGELVAHSQVPLNAANAAASYNGSIQVFVDYMYENPRPVLYYRFYESSSGSSNLDTQFAYNFKDNGVYCMPGETLVQGSWQNPGNGQWSFQDGLGSYLGSAAASAGYVLVSAGPDRQYFSSASVCSLSRY